MATFLTVQDFQNASAQEKGVLIDVRTPGEYASGHVPEAVNVPLKEVRAESIRARFGDQPIHFVCQSGSRSEQAANILERAGLKRVYSLDGGTEAFKKAGVSLETGSSPAAAHNSAPAPATAAAPVPRTRPPAYLLYPESLKKENWVALRAAQEAWREAHPQPKPAEVVHHDLPDNEGWHTNGKGVKSRPERLAALHDGFSGERIPKETALPGGLSAARTL
ncbi:MAG: rhodanese-like domain-containing protein [Verrucomicrobium sp.]|nr:rhodanese-like domain-containing protein [Verrucomicrobium sp.]